MSRAPRRSPSDDRPQTLPLFGELSRAGPGSRRAPRPGPSKPSDLAMHIYWSASLEAHALGSMALSTPYPDQRRALVELQAMEEQRKGLARLLLERVWDIELPGPSSAVVGGEENERWQQHAA